MATPTIPSTSKTETSETEEDFGKRVKGLMEGGAITLGLAMGVSTGLLGKMSSFPEPKTCQQIAEECDLKERYVREWLGIMVCGRIIDLDATAQKFFLPHHRRPPFTRGCREEAEGAQLVRCLPELARTFDELGRCFKLDGPVGIPGSIFTFTPEMSHVRFEDHLIEELGRFPGLNLNLEAGASVLDVACGKGVSTCLMAEHFLNSRFTGLDIADQYLAEAAARATNQELRNVEFVCASGSDMPPDWSGKFDFLFLYNGVHDAFRPDKLLEECLRVMKPGAKAMILEPAAMSNLADNAQTAGTATLYTFSLFRCLPTSLHHTEPTEGDGLGLGAAWGRDRCHNMLQETGFNVLSVDKEIGGKTWKFSCTKPI